MSSIQFEVCLNKNPNVFNLRLLTHVHQISVAITHGRWNRKRIGPRKYETGKALPRYRRLDLAAEAIGSSCRDCCTCCRSLTPPHGWRPTSVDYLYLDGGLYFSWMMAHQAIMPHGVRTAKRQALSGA